MFFILNNENTVLAADEACLEAIGVSSVFLLSERFRSGEFVLDEEGHTVHVDGVVHRFEKHTVQTLLGRGYYYQLIEADAHAQEEETVTSPRETIEDLIPVTTSDAIEHSATQAVQPVADLEETHSLPSEPDLPLETTLSLDTLADLEPDTLQDVSPTEASPEPAADETEHTLLEPMEQTESPEETFTPKATTEELLSADTPSIDAAPSLQEKDDLLDLLDLDEPTETQTSQAAIPTALCFERHLHLIPMEDHTVHRPTLSFPPRYERILRQPQKYRTLLTDFG